MSGQTTSFLSAALAYAIMNGQTEKVATLLRQGADIFEPEQRTGLPPLVMAERYGAAAANPADRSAATRYGAAARIEVANLVREHARTLPFERFSLYDAVLIRHLAAIDHCIRHAPPSQGNAEGYCHAFVRAVQRDDAEIIAMLLAAGVSPDTRMPGRPTMPPYADWFHTWVNWPVLAFATYGGHLAAVRALLQAGADPNAQPLGPAQPMGPWSTPGVTTLMLAAGRPTLALVKLLVEAGADVTARDAKGRTVPAYARQGGYKRVIAYLDAAHEKAGGAAALDLFEAAANGIVARVKTLLEQGADTGQRNADGETPLMVAAARGQAEVVQALCAAGADVQATRRPDGTGDLWDLALRGGDLDVIRCLIAHGLDPNRPRVGRPPLAMAVGLANARPLLQVLLQSGADPHAIVELRKPSPLVRRRALPDDLPDRCSVIEFAKHFAASKDTYFFLKQAAGEADDSGEFFYESLRDSLKTCAARADAAFMAEAARIGAILGAKPQPWKKRKGVLHFMAHAERALAAHYGETPPAGEPIPLRRGFLGSDLLERLQAEVAAKGYSLVYTGLESGPHGLKRLLLFPLGEPLAALVACGTNGANYGLGTREVVNWCAETREQHKLTVVGAGFDFLELGFSRPIQNAEALAASLGAFCRDLQLRPDDPQAVAAFARQLAAAGRCFLWWD